MPDDESKLKKIVNEIGYPIILKATAGGGGRGMRVVTNENDLLDSLRITKQEALNAFGNDKVYIEKFIQKPRHIEVQIVGDGKGNAIHLGTRDCTCKEGIKK